jgi:uncharacterized protein (DUF924 family)
MTASFAGQHLRDVHQFWFGELAPPQFLAAEEKSNMWFNATPNLDDAIRTTFGSHLDAARTASSHDLAALSPVEQIGLIVLLDQFPRNMFRGTAEQFGCDAIARGVARRLVAGDCSRFCVAERQFLYLPFEHSEDSSDQDLSVSLFAGLACEAPPYALEDARLALDYATRHRDVIRKFGRFPHRNAYLGRESTPDEVAFLKTGRGF